MDNSIKIFKNDVFGEVRVAGTSEEPLFCLADVCNAVELSNPSSVKTRLNDEDLQLLDLHALNPDLYVNGNSFATFITESAFYDVLLFSSSKKVKPYRRWVTHEILPSIRKYGAYMTSDTIEKALTSPDFLIQLATTLKEEKQKRIEAEKKVEEQAPKVLFADAVIGSRSSCLISCKNPKEIVTVKNKASRLHDRVREMTKSIKSIEPIGRKIGRCITVSNQHGLYATKDFIVTHNSFALVLALAEPLMTDGDFRAVITRRSLQSQKTGGSFVDTFKAIFGDYCSVKTADSPRISFPSGAYCDLTYIDDTNLDKMREQWKGKQIDAICIDEITEMSWEAFSYVQTRNRGRSKTFTGKFFATLNPKRSHWTRKFLDWYIGVDGFIMPDRNGKVRYFYVNGSTVDDVVWGDSKEEVYAKCKIDIDRKLARIGGDFDYTNMIKSFVFYQGKLSENRAMLENNPNYIGSVAASGGKMAQAIIEGNFNVDPEENEKIPIPSTSAQSVFNNNPAVNGDKWITVDLADYGTDNLVALAWDGFHAYDILILSKSTPRENAMAVKTFAFEHGTAESHIIFDATAGRYFNDYIPDAVPYISLNKPFGLYQLTAMTVKDMCYIRLCKMIEEGNLTFDDKLAVQTYTHQNLKYKVTVENEFMEECSVVRFDDMQSGKKRLWNKKKMNQMLGKGRSMDLLDPCAMRMLPCANIEYGNEIQAGYYNHEEETKQASHAQTEGSIYDEHLWY